MKHTFLSKLAVAAALALPLSAQAQVKYVMTGPKAEAAASAAIAGAPKVLEEIANVPVEFALAAIVPDSAGANPTKAELVAALGARLAYWKSVSAELAVERKEVEESLKSPETSPEDLIRAARRSTQLSRLSSAADAVAADAAQDAFLAASLDGQRTESNQELLNRKTQLFTTVRDLK